MQPTFDKTFLAINFIASVAISYGLVIIYRIFSTLSFGISYLTFAFIFSGIAFIVSAIGLMKMKKWGVYVLIITSLLTFGFMVNDSLYFTSPLTHYYIYFVIVFLYFISINKRFS